ncbi:hypothetical protein CSE16_12570 [Solibacillus sp. R5-41]|nr:hypothetical protein CSE16_12570 [Solibacillus sp. R5-41]
MFKYIGRYTTIYGYYWYIFGTGLTSITEVELNLEIVMLILMTFGSFIYFIVTNIVLTILLGKKQFHDKERIKLEKNQIKEPIET